LKEDRLEKKEDGNKNSAKPFVKNLKAPSEKGVVTSSNKKNNFKF
jgi:hypothetical protein